MKKKMGERERKREREIQMERGGGREVRRKKAFLVSHSDYNIILFYPEKLSA